MKTHPSIDTLHPEAHRGEYRTVKGDYPVRLMTKRTYGHLAAEIMFARRTAPHRIAPDRTAGWRRRPPC